MTEAHERFAAWQRGRNALALEIDTATTALLVIDMQEYFLNPQSPFARAMERRAAGFADYYLERSRSTVEPNLQKLLARFRERGGRVIFTTVASEFPDGQDLSPTFRRMNAEAMGEIGAKVIPPRTDPWAHIVDSLEPLEGEAVVNKTTFGGFASTGLDGTLRNLGIETLVIGGVVTNRCVETTARDATDRGYRVILVDDGTATYSPELQEMCMLSLMVSHGFVRTTEEILALLEA